MIFVFFQETYNNISTVSYDYECEEFDDISDNAKVNDKKNDKFPELGIKKALVHMAMLVKCAWSFCLMDIYKGL